jgi:hypothetical protein
VRNAPGVFVVVGLEESTVHGLFPPARSDGIGRSKSGVAATVVAEERKRRGRFYTGLPGLQSERFSVHAFFEK